MWGTSGLFSAVWDEGGSGSLIPKELFHPSLGFWEQKRPVLHFGNAHGAREAKPWVGPATYWLLPDVVEELRNLQVGELPQTK